MVGAPSVPALELPYWVPLLARVSSTGGGGQGGSFPPNDPTSHPKRSVFHITETESL